MNIHHYKEVEDIFVEVIDVPAHQRRSKINQLTTDPQLIESVEELLEEHDRLLHDDFMNSGVLDLPLSIEPDTTADPCPVTIQGYSIVRALGRGSSGTVYLAKSSFPLERLVALKLIHSGSGKNTLARFREEQRILAKLKHIGIAEVYDQGVAEGGRPFTVLEYIEGESITDHCKSHHLQWRGVVELIAQCCDAVAHAHHRNIIHRDLKPSNLMVSLVDGMPQVKVIDFGTAKLLDPFLLASQITVDSQFVGTLPYSSPEQLSGVDTPDTRTDVHGLGVVLFECLEGKHPFFESGIGLKSAIDMIMTKQVPELQNKHDLPTKELNAIITQACAKEPGDRYASLIHLSEDLNNLLDGLPVHAIKARPTYLAKKFIRRHRVSIALTSTVIAMLAVMAGIAITQGIRAKTHRNAMRQTAIRMVDDLMPMLADLSGSSDARRELTSSLHDRINELLHTGPNDHELLLRKAYILEYKSDMALSDGLIDTSEALRLQALGITKSLRISDSESADILAMSHRRLTIKLGDTAKARMDYSSARNYYEQAHTSLLTAPGDHRSGLCWSFERLSWIARKQHRPQDALDLAQRRMALSIELLSEHPNSAILLRNCATGHQMMSQIAISNSNFESSLDHARHSVELAQKLMLLEPDSYFSQEMELHAAVVLSRSLLFIDQEEEAAVQATRILFLANQLVKHNPGRQDVREIAWNKLKITRDIFRSMAPQQSMAQIKNAMQVLIPNRPH